MTAVLLLEMNNMEPTIFTPNKPFLAYVKNTYASNIQGKTIMAYAKVVKVELNYWATPDGRMQRVYLNGIGPKGGVKKLGWVQTKEHYDVASLYNATGERALPVEEIKRMVQMALQVIQEHDGEMPQKVIYVHCTKCGTQFDENKVEITDISENLRGQDVVVFKCPCCGEVTESLRVG